LALLRLYRATNNPEYLQLLQEITQAIPQFMSHQTRPIAGMAPGWINERVSTTDWYEGIGEIKAGSTWAETSMLLTVVELPSIYIDSELNRCFVFDHLEAKILSSKRNKMQIEVTNPTQFEAEFLIVVENKQAKAFPWKENSMLNVKKYRLEAGKGKMLEINGL
jgi:hypothetical protein